MFKIFKLRCKKFIPSQVFCIEIDIQPITLVCSLMCSHSLLDPLSKVFSKDINANDPAIRPNTQSTTVLPFIFINYIHFKNQYYNNIQVMSLKDYQFLGKLGSGSFGVVYKARNKKNNEIVVVKQVDISKMDSRSRNTALNEAKIMKDIDSPYIVKYYSSFLQKSILNIIMEYCSGGDLSSFMKSQMGKPIKEESIWKFIIQIFIGLRDLHKKKILHRDIKALNVFLDADKNIRIGDLGVAKEMKADFANTVVGTPYYLSPEMCEEKPYNDRTDIWATGCLIYQLCTGKHPFQAQNQAALALKIVLGKFKDIPNYYSKDLDWLIKSCLSVDHKRRPTASYLLSKSQIIDWGLKSGVIIESGQAKNAIIVPQKDKGDKIDNIIKIQQEKQPNKNGNIKAAVSKNQVEKNKRPSLNKQKINVEKAKVSLEKEVERQKLKIKEKQKEKEKEKQMKPSSEKKTSCLPPKQIKIPKIISASRKYQIEEKNNVKAEISIKKIQSQPANEKKNQIPTQKQRTKNKLYNPQRQISKFQQDFSYSYSEFEKEDIQRSKFLQQIPKNESSDSETQKQKINIQKRAMIIGQFQQQMNDQQLQAQFGIQPPSKKQNKISFQLKNVENIDWNIEKQNKSIDFLQLPTIKVASNKDQVNQLFINTGQTEQIYEEIDDNQPFKFQQESNNQEVQQQLLIQDTQQQQFEHLQKRIQQNKKRMNELQNLKKHHQFQLLSKISKGQYQKLKQMVVNGTEQQIQKLLKKWMSNSIGLTKFYKILHYDIEIQRCCTNIKSFEIKINQIKKHK